MIRSSQKIPLIGAVAALAWAAVVDQLRTPFAPATAEQFVGTAALSSERAELARILAFEALDLEAEGRPGQMIALWEERFEGGTLSGTLEDPPPCEVFAALARAYDCVGCSARAAEAYRTAAFYLETQDLPWAVECLRRSLALEPGDRGAERRLVRLVGTPWAPLVPRPAPRK